ncbi:MAG: hypothetical protein HYV16_08460 [Gammaproteobacteria bacterium]|nr:hypothetical protein [Gammaproteobacteria bacterium]
MPHTLIHAFRLAILGGACLLAACSPFAPAYDGQGNHYTVRLDEGAKTAEVEADIWLPTTTLAMFNVSPVEGLPNGFADLVEGLEARDAQGEAMSVHPLGMGDYELGEAGRIKLRYRLRLEHDRYRWPAGIEEVAYHTDEGWMTTGYALFFGAAEAMQGEFDVSFQLPKGWKAHTPWQPDGENRFRLASRRELMNNSLFFGTAHSETVKLGGVDVELVLGKRYAAQKAQFLDLLKPQMDSYLSLFGAKPLAPRFLIIVNEGGFADGGAFSGSFSQIIEGDADDASRVLWGYTLSHELLHFWNGLSLVPSDEQEEWFKEGATDYLTILTQARNGLVDEALLFKRLENLPRRYLIARMAQGLSMSVREAGKNKQPNRQLVYGGGSLAALALDVQLRKASGDRLGLPELMRSLYAEFGKPGKTYALSDLERHAKTLTGQDFHAFFAKAVGSGEYFDIKPYLKDLGLRVDSFVDEFYISRDPRATEAQKARFEAVFGRR